MQFFRFFMLGIFGLTTAASAEGVRDAHYSTPVPAELGEFGTLDVQNATFTQTGEQYSIKYRLPGELVGTDSSDIELIEEGGAPNGGLLHPMIARMDAGGQIVEVGNASCSKHPRHDKNVFCMIMYHSLTINTDSVEQYLRQSYPDSGDYVGRSKVAALFANEPVGVLAIELK